MAFLAFATIREKEGEITCVGGGSNRLSCFESFLHSRVSDELPAAPGRSLHRRCLRGGADLQPVGTREQEQHQFPHGGGLSMCFITHIGSLVRPITVLCTVFK